MKKNLRGIILDVDGTLIDSNHAHAESWGAALCTAGLNFPTETILRLIGMGGDKLLPTLTGIQENSDFGQQIARHRTEIFKKQYVPHLKAFPGARELLVKTQNSGLRLAVATSAKAEELDKILSVTGLSSVLKIPKCTKDDASNSKPDPDIVLAALEELEMSPEEVLMLGDTPYDIHAAKEAGVKTIALRSGGWDNQGLRGAIAVYENTQDLLNHYEESSLGELTKSSSEEAGQPPLEPGHRSGDRFPEAG